MGMGLIDGGEVFSIGGCLNEGIFYIFPFLILFPIHSPNHILSLIYSSSCSQFIPSKSTIITFLKLPIYLIPLSIPQSIIFIFLSFNYLSILCLNIHKSKNRYWVKVPFSTLCAIIFLLLFTFLVIG